MYTGRRERTYWIMGVQHGGDASSQGIHRYPDRFACATRGTVQASRWTQRRACGARGVPSGNGGRSQMLGSGLFGKRPAVRRV